MPNKSENNKTEKPKKIKTKNVKKTTKELKVEIIEDINNSLKEEITAEVVQDIKKSINTEYKDEIKNEIKTELVDDIKKDIQKEQKKLNRSKSFKIFRLYIYLFTVVACLFYIMYRLYTTDNMNLINEKYTKRATTQLSETKITEPVVEEVKDLNYYINKYSYLLDNLKISNVELVKGNNLVENISLTDRLALAYGSLTEEDIIVDGIIHSVGEQNIEEAYQKIFGSLEGYAQENFTVHGLTYTYSSTNNSYMAIGEEDTSVSYVNNIIIDIKEEENDLVFAVKTYIIKNDYVYSTNNLNYRLMAVQENMDVTKIQNSLSSVEYRFTKGNNGYRLLSISKK